MEQYINESIHGSIQNMKYSYVLIIVYRYKYFADSITYLINFTSGQFITKIKDSNSTEDCLKKLPLFLAFRNVR